jgi:hypothetical protein
LIIPRNALPLFWLLSPPTSSQIASFFIIGNKSAITFSRNRISCLPFRAGITENSPSPNSITTQGQKDSIFIVGIEKTVHMHDKITHMGVINSHLRLGSPRGQRGSVVRIDADDIERIQIPELYIMKIFQFAAEHKVQQLFLFARFRHVLSLS